MEKQYAKELVEFIHESPTNFHAVANAKKELLGNGYKQLFSGEAWQIERGGKYFVTKNHSSLFAFEIGSGEIAEEGFKIVCAHSDSCCREVFEIEHGSVWGADYVHVVRQTIVHGRTGYVA